MVNISVEVVIFNDKKLLNEKHIDDQLKQSNLQAITLQDSPKLRKQRQEIQYCGDNQPCRKLLQEDFAVQIKMDCRTTPAVRFRAKLRFN